MCANAIKVIQVEFVISQFVIIPAAFTDIVLLQIHASVKLDGKVAILPLSATQLILFLWTLTVSKQLPHHVQNVTTNSIWTRLLKIALDAAYNTVRCVLCVILSSVWSANGRLTLIKTHREAIAYRLGWSSLQIYISILSKTSSMLI